MEKLDGVMAGPAAAVRSGIGKHLLGAAVTLLCLGVLAYRVDLAEVVAALARFRWEFLVPALAALGAGYALRILRWSVMLRAAGGAVGVRGCVAPFMAAIALNNVLPFRLGDIIRALVFPASMGISKATAAGSLVVERLVDLLSLLAGLSVGLIAIRTLSIPPHLEQLALTLAVGGGVTLFGVVLFSAPLAAWLRQMSQRRGPAKSAVLAGLAALLAGFAAMSRPQVLLAMGGLSVGVWLGEAGLFYFVLLGAGIAATPATALLVMAVATLSTLVPSSPGYVGPFHLAVFAAVTLVGGSAAQAGSYAVIVHLALWLPTTLAGAAAIWARPDLFKAAKNRAPLSAPVQE